jgi:hypothetical protein
LRQPAKAASNATASPKCTARILRILSMRWLRPFQRAGRAYCAICDVWPNLSSLAFLWEEDARLIPDKKVLEGDLTKPETVYFVERLVRDCQWKTSSPTSDGKYLQCRRAQASRKQ